jgi:arginyl-tRNA synthetase
MNTIQEIQHSFINYLKSTYTLTSELEQKIEITLNTDSQKQAFGDLSSNAALIIAKNIQQEPRALAQALATGFTHEFIERLEVAGPGFINFFLTQQAFEHLARQLIQNNEQFFKAPAHAPVYNYNIEFVSANPTGPLHIGHGRGGIIGDVLARILKFLGQIVTTEFYINDAGSQIQKLGISFKLRCQQLVGHAVELPEDAYHGEYLIELARECLAQHGHEVLDRPNNFFSQYAYNKLLSHIQQTLKNYTIDFDVWFSEKKLHESNAIEHALELLRQNGYSYTQDNALWFASTAFGDDKDRVLRKSSGELTYVAADIAYLENKFDRGYNKLIMVLGQDHHSYVIRLHAALQALGKNKNQLDIILYQLVTVKESGVLVRMSKRAGRVVTLQDVIDTVGTDVARFFYLRKKADAHLDFDIDLALKKTEENPVYYIQYAYVRTGSILEKATQEPALQNITAQDCKYITIHERLLLKKIAALQQLILSISVNYQVHLLTYYVLELTQLFHSYYASTKVIDLTQINTSRGRLSSIVMLRRTLKLCFDLLGISSPERM